MPHTSTLGMDGPRRFLKSKHYRRLYWRCCSVIGVVALTLAVTSLGWYEPHQYGHNMGHGIFRTEEAKTGEDSGTGRQLLSAAPSPAPCNEETGEDCDYPRALGKYGNQPSGYIVFYIIGVLYMFLCIAIICDEFFVPTLTVLYSKDYLNLSDDVAGATLMAAGGSAPELATSFIGTFKGSPVGFGTIVGSAVFNVLFVIGMCAVFSKDVLQLTWWPLFRDCMYYTFTLILLFLFFGPISKQEIEWWEAFLLFLSYIGYCALMKCHLRVRDAIMRFRHGQEWESKVELQAEDKLNLNFKTPSKFRTGIVSLLTSDKSIVETAGIAAVVTLRGDVLEIFNELDTDNDKRVHKDELAQLLLKVSGLDKTPSMRELTSHVDEIYKSMKNLSSIEEESGKETPVEKKKELDASPATDGRKRSRSRSKDRRPKPIDDDLVTLDEFTAWYVASEKRILDEMERTWNYFDRNGDGVISEAEIREVFKFMNFTLRRGKSMIFTENEIEDECSSLLSSMDTNKSGGVEKDEFMRWYRQSMFWQKAKRVQETEVELSEPIEIGWPEADDPIRAKIFFFLTLPILALLLHTMPDVSKPGQTFGIDNRRWCVVAFFESLFYIMLFSYYMVDFAEVIGDTCSIPPAVMGLTILAAGTSVPDLLSSVIVARQGKGDMAVSSSVGSNIFDVTVGLPVPWLSYCIVKGRSVDVTAKSLEFSVLVLIFMLLAVVLTVHYSDWHLTKELGFAMFGLYFVFVGQDLIFNFVCADDKLSYFDGC